MCLLDSSADWRIALACLYLPGSPHGLALQRRRWLGVVGVLRSAQVSLEEIPQVLRVKGFPAESIALQSPNALDWARSRIALGEVLTALDDGYPARWLAILGESAPPALWMRGAQMGSRSWIGVVGSRHVTGTVRRFCAEVASEAIELGHGVVSGGAIGCDRSALNACHQKGGASLILLPRGWADGDRPRSGQETLLSLCVPGEEFSTGRAMERNALIYAAGNACVVAHARFREGGTWHGAVDALRRRLTQVVVRQSEDQAHQSLVALGGVPIAHPSRLGKALQQPPRQEGLFRSMKIA